MQNNKDKTKIVLIVALVILIVGVAGIVTGVVGYNLEANSPDDDTEATMEEMEIIDSNDLGGSVDANALVENDIIEMPIIEEDATPEITADEPITEVPAVVETTAIESEAVLP